MPDKILHKRNLTTGNIPTTSSLEPGELAINVADGKLFLRQSGSAIDQVVTVGLSSSYASTASYIQTAQTASYITSSNVYGPFGSNSIVSASYADTASFSTAASANQILVLNQSGQNIAKGLVVHITGSNTSSDIPRVITASFESDSVSANTLGIASQLITAGTTGFVTTEGVVTGIDTSAFISGQLVYLGATGSIIGAAPLAPAHSVRLGQVVRHQSINGSIYVRVDNGYELGELHDVLITGSATGDLLVRSGSVWINSKQLSGSYSLTGSLTATSFTGSLFGTATTASYVLQAVSSSFATSASYAPDTTFPYTGSARITGSLGVTGSITAIQIGAGAMPSGSVPLDIRSNGASSTDIAFRVRNNTDTRDIINVRGNKTLELISDTPATYGGISISADTYNASLINTYNSFGTNIIRIDSQNNFIGVAGSGNIRIGNFTIDGYMGMVTPSTNNRYLKLVDAFSSEYLSIGGNSYDGSGGISMTLKTTTTNGTNFVTFSRSNNTNPVVINDSGYVGIGTASPAARLDIKAQGALSSDTAFRVRNSADNQNLMSITGDGQIVIGLSASINLGANSLPYESVVIGKGASAGLYATAIGAASQADYYSSVAIGRSSRAGGESVAIGYGAIAYNSAIYPTLAIGYGANASGIYSGVISIGNPGITNALGSSFAFGINNSGNAQSLFFNRNTNIVLRSNTALTSGTHFDANATNTITIHSGSIPTTIISGSVQMYAATGSLTDNTRPHFRTGNGTVVWLGDQTRLFNVTASNMLVGVTSSLALFTSQNITANVGTTTIYAFPTSSYDGAFIDYTARSGSNARAGQIMGIRSGSAVNYAETTTTDFGSTADITFGMSISASSMIISASATSAAWTVKTIIRSI